jgi:hypothetical protein
MESLAGGQVRRFRWIVSSGRQARAGRRRVARETVRDERGQVLPLLAGGMAVFMLFVALAVNIGMWYASDSGLQRAADLSALAGAQYLATNGSLDAAGYPCATATGASLTDKAMSCASIVAGLNGIAGAKTATPSIVSVNGNQAVKVVAAHADFSGVFFTSTRRESATAVVAGIAGAENSFPATFAQQSWTPGQHVNFVFGTAQLPGAFNLVQSCGTNGGGGSPSEQQLITCFECTQTYTVQDNSLVPDQLPSGCANVLPLCVDGNVVGSDPGNNLNKSVVDAINTLSGKVVLIPAYSGYQGSGNNATYTIAGFAEMLLDDPAAKTVGTGSNKSIEISGMFVQELAPSDVQGSCTGTGGNFGATTFFLSG